MNYLTIEQLLALHLMAIKRYGGSEGVRDMGRLQAALAAQEQMVFGHELYQTIFDKAAAMCRGIIGDHPFVDGNKRTGMLAALTFLKINGAVFQVDQGEIEDFAVRVATDHLDVAQISQWLEEHCR